MTSYHMWPNTEGITKLLAVISWRITSALHSKYFRAISFGRLNFDRLTTICQYFTTYGNQATG